MRNSIRADRSATLSLVFPLGIGTVLQFNGQFHIADSCGCGLQQQRRKQLQSCKNLNGYSFRMISRHFVRLWSMGSSPNYSCGFFCTKQLLVSKLHPARSQVVRPVKNEKKKTHLHLPPCLNKKKGRRSQESSSGQRGSNNTSSRCPKRQCAPSFFYEIRITMVLA
jgi:hypothetical protein